MHIVMRAILTTLSLLPLAATAGWVTIENSACTAFAEFSDGGDKATWTGACQDGKVHGAGVLTVSSGTLIEGEYRDGRPFNARGREPILVFSNGRRMIAEVVYSEGSGARYGSGAKQGTPTGALVQTHERAADYADRIRAAIRPHIVLPDDVEGNPVAELKVSIRPGGEVIDAELLRSSGSNSWDKAVRRAVLKAGRVPPDADGKVPPVLILTFRPQP